MAVWRDGRFDRVERDLINRPKGNTECEESCDRAVIGAANVDDRPVEVLADVEFGARERGSVHVVEDAVAVGRFARLLARVVAVAARVELVRGRERDLRLHEAREEHPVLHQRVQLVEGEQVARVALCDHALRLGLRDPLESEVEVAHPEHVVVPQNGGRVAVVEVVRVQDAVHALDPVGHLVIVRGQVRVHDTHGAAEAVETNRDSAFVSLFRLYSKLVL